MGISELAVIILVVIILVKPDDIPKLAKKLKQIRSYFVNIRSEIISQIDIDSNESQQFVEEDQNKINYYLEKIASYGEVYEGEYDLNLIKKRFDDVVSKKVNNIKNTNLG